jgi:uncharacterized protein YraI
MSRVLFVVRKQSHAWVCVVALVTLALLWPARPSEAQTRAPTPTPASITVIVGAGGSALWNAEDGMLVTVLAPAAQLNASARSADEQWFFAETADGKTGWVTADDVLVFNESVLPTEDITVSPAPPTPVPQPTSTVSAESSQSEDGTIPPIQSTTVTTPTEGIQVTVEEVNLNIRSGPGTNYPVIGRANSGQQLTAIGRNQSASWVQIETPSTAGSAVNRPGWVSASYVEASQSINGLPIVETPAPPAVSPSTATSITKTTAAPQPTAAPIAQATSGQPTGLRGKLVMQVSAGGPIYIYELETGVLRQLTGGFDPSISPDGSQVVFTRLGGQQGIYLINVDGSNERNIFSERVGYFGPKFSPDGRWIGFTRTDGIEECFDFSEAVGRNNCLPGLTPFIRSFPRIKEVRPRIARIDTDGKNYRDIPTLEAARAIDWNSAGIVYSSPAGLQATQDAPEDLNRSVYFDVYQQYYHDPDWQPGGGKIVFHHRRPGHWDIYSVNPDGTGFTALTRPATALVDVMPSSVAPAWSPDGQHIVFLSNRQPDNEAGAWGVWVMDADGGNQRRLPIELPFDYSYVEEQMIDWGP